MVEGIGVRPLDLGMVVLSFFLAAILTRLVRAFARSKGIVARPKSDRWHQKPTALMGGVAIFITVLSFCSLLVPVNRQSLVVVGGSAFLFAVGLVDDLFQLKPYQKLIGQLMGAMPVIFVGLTLPWTGSPAIDLAITTFWLIGITNAINLLDNMDGLAAGIAAIAAGFLSLNFWLNDQPNNALMLAVFAASLLGFLVYNAQPATIFMGDCGSLFIGFFLASASLLNPAGGRSRSLLPVIAVPVLILFIPIFDTIFVTVLRKLAGRAATQGGRDHTSHRLVALGLSERRAVRMLYGFALVSGFLAFLVCKLDLDVSVAAILGFTIALTFLGVHLADVKVYDDRECLALRDQPLVAFLVDLSYKRRVFEVLLDVLLIGLSYYTSFVLVFGTITAPGARNKFLQTLPVLVFVKMASFLGLGVYRGLWRYLGLDNLIIYAKAVLAGSIVSALTLRFGLHIDGLSRVVFVLDGLILFFLLTGSRMAFRLFRQLLPRPVVRGGRRVLIYGAGDAGELLLRELDNNPDLRYVPVGFMDDDPLKKGKVIHGVPVLGGNGAFRSICEHHRVDEVLISSSKFSADRIDEIRQDCESASIVLKRLRLQIEEVSKINSSDSEVSAVLPQSNRDLVAAEG